VTVAVEVRGTGTHDGREIDVAVVNVLRFEAELVSGVDTHFSDFGVVGAYFGPARLTRARRLNLAGLSWRLGFSKPPGFEP
jgi:hypothetical protein